MNKAERNRIIKPLKSAHKSYIEGLQKLEPHLKIPDRFAKVIYLLQSLLRKEIGSQNSIDLVSNLARLIFGLKDDISRLKLNDYNFSIELDVINNYTIDYLEARRSSQYSQQCASYGETLLNCYLDLFITLTVPNTPRLIGVKPGFLINPSTGNNLEIDILLEEFRLGFEFQGEHHYRESSVMAKDKFKLSSLKNHNRVLIPTNISQLSFNSLAVLICNSIKDFLNLHELFTTSKNSSDSSNIELLKFMKAVQRIYLATIIFTKTGKWLDSYSNRYQTNMATSNPYSTGNPAPRQSLLTNDLSVKFMYQKLRKISDIRKSSKSYKAR